MKILDRALACAAVAVGVGILVAAGTMFDHPVPTALEATLGVVAILRGVHWWSVS